MRWIKLPVLLRRLRGQSAAAGLYDRVLTEMEYPLILAALTATRGNQIKAADLLGLKRNTLRKKIRELGVSVYRSSRTA
ncbi:DNA-binding protein Fis [Rhizobium leguminosarum]